jgi:uncharacterized protein
VVIPWGTIANAAAIIAGSSVGLLLRRGLPERIRGIVFQAIGLTTLVLGMQMALKVDSAPHMLQLVFAMLLGGITGEALNLEARLERASEWLKHRVGLKGEARFTEGLVTAFLIYCIGAMTFVGALNEGMSGDRSLLLIKSVLDGFMSIALASTFGAGVAFSVVPLLIFQFAVTLLGASLGGVFTETAITQLSAVGGVLIIGIGVNLLGLAKLRLTNLLPALVYSVAFTLLLG